MPAVGNNIPADPREWTISTVDAARTLALAAVGGESGYEENLAYLRGDHKQDLKPWMGPGRADNGTISSQTKVRIGRQFVGIPESTQCVERRVAGVAGTEADFKVSPQRPEGQEQEDGTREPSESQKTEAAKYHDEVGQWWMSKGYWKSQKQAIRLGSAAERACMRLFINPAALVDGRGGAKQVPRMPRDKAMSVVECVAEWPGTCGIYTNPDTLERVGFWLGVEPDGTRVAEVWFVRDGKTVLRRMRGTEEDATERTFDWGGIMPIIPLEIPPLLTPAVRQQQAALDTMTTAIVRLGEAHGYAQREVFESLPPGSWKTDPPTDTTLLISRPLNGVTYYYHVDPSGVLGNGVTVYHMPIEYTVEIDDTATGSKEKIQLSSPRVEYHEPSPPDNIIRIADHFRHSIRKSCWQGHITEGSDAESSGNAYEQARAEFEADLDSVAGEVAAQTQRVLTAVIVIAEWIAGANDAPFLRDWTIDVNTVTDAGPVSSDKIRINNECVQAGTLSLPTALQLNGIRDVPAEVERIFESEAKVLALVKMRHEIVNLMRQGGVDPVEAYKEMGWPDDRAAVLGRTDGGFTEQ